jgi:hypothetical protein
MNSLYCLAILGLVFFGCTGNKIEKKGFQVNQITENEEGEKIVGLPTDSLKLETRPRNVLLTYFPEHRLTPIYKVNYSKNKKKRFSGSNAFHRSWNNQDLGNNWNNNFMPGFKAVYGYNFVNVSHYNNQTKTENKLFNKPVLIKTLYYPAFSNDTLNYQPISRNYYMVSTYDEDSNGDGFISTKDLRRFYYFDLNGKNKRALIPKEYSVMSSEYDMANDFMYVFAKKDINQNGQMESDEPTEIFWIDLKHPEIIEKQYTSE